jgi:hypothetical protein
MTEFHDVANVARDKDKWEEAWDEWWRTDRVDAVGWALLFFWGALVIVGDATSFRDGLDWWEPWGVFFVGAGVIVLVEGVVRLFMTEYRSKFGWTLFWGTVFLSLGLGGLAHPAWHALPLVAIAVITLRSAFVGTS